MGRNNSVGEDDIPAEVFRYGSLTLFRVLACLFNKMLSNIFLPIELMKNKTLISSDTRNCRPNALPEAASKLLKSFYKTECPRVCTHQGAHSGSLPA